MATSTRKTKPISLFARIAAITASLALLLSNIDTIKSWIWPQAFPSKPTVGWLTVASQGQLNCVVPDEMRFSLGDGRSVSVLQTDCAKTLQEKAKSISHDGETLQNARFLLVKNTIDASIDQLVVRSRTGTPIATLRSLAKDETVAICISYDGKNGNAGHTLDPAEIQLAVYGDLAQRTFPVPVPPSEVESRGVGVPGCPGVDYGYPSQGHD